VKGSLHHQPRVHRKLRNDLFLRPILTLVQPQDDPSEIELLDEGLADHVPARLVGSSLLRTENGPVAFVEEDLKTRAFLERAGDDLADKDTGRCRRRNKPSAGRHLDDLKTRRKRTRFE
jgi:hypothetical protein